MGSVTNLEWENNNSLRAYPFRENSSVESSTNGLRLPPEAILDFSAFIQANDLDSEFFLSSIEIAPDLTSVLHFSGATSGNEIATVTIPLGFTPGSSVEVVGTGLGTTGKLVVGPGFVSVQRWGIGSFGFLAANSTLESTVAVPLNLGVVTSVGIHTMTRSLVGDVKLEAGRAIREETIVEHNSLVIDAIKSVEDCECLMSGCPIQSINGIKPDQFGNIVISTEGIIAWSPSFNGLHIDGIWSEKFQCPTVFTPGLRGPPGPTGPGGPAGPDGFDVLCSGGICCECQICDQCQIGDGGVWSPARLIGSNANPTAVNVGDTVTLYGVDLTFPPNPGTPWTIAAVLCPKNGAAVTVPFDQPPTYTSVTIVIPAGITTSPSPTADNKYDVRLITPWGYTNSIELCINPVAVGPTQIENFNPPSLGNWADIRGPGYLFPAPTQMEGAGAFEVQNISPGGILVTGGPLSGAGAPPWDFSGYSVIRVFCAKEFDPLEGGPADQFVLQLVDSLANMTSIFVPTPPAARFPAPHALNPVDFQPINFTLPPGPADLTDIVTIFMGTQDFATAIPITAWHDNMVGIP